jgi:transposase
MNTLIFICPDCNHELSKQAAMPPKDAFALVPDPVPCPRCHNTYPRAWLIANQLLFARKPVDRL